MAAYLHKKFKKYATEKENGAEHEEDGAERHSAGSIVGPLETPTEGRRLGVVKPLHRQYYCDICRIAFRVESNLEKHIQTRSHKLKLEKDENTSELDIIKELGESGKVELDQPEDLEDPNIPGAADQPAKTDVPPILSSVNNSGPLPPFHPGHPRAVRLVGGRLVEGRPLDSRLVDSRLANDRLLEGQLPDGRLLESEGSVLDSRIPPQLISYAKVDPLVYFNPQQLRGLDPQQLRGLNPQVLRGLDQQQMKGLDPQQLRGLDPHQVIGLDPQHLRGLDPQQLRRLDPQQLRGLDNQQLRGLDPQQLRGLDPQHLRGLDSQLLLRGLDPQQLRGLNSLQLSGLDPHQLRGLDPQQLRGLDPLQLQGLDPLQLNQIFSHSVHPSIPPMQSHPALITHPLRLSPSNQSSSPHTSVQIQPRYQNNKEVLEPKNFTKTESSKFQQYFNRYPVGRDLASSSAPQKELLYAHNAQRENQIGFVSKKEYSTNHVVNRDASISLQEGNASYPSPRGSGFQSNYPSPREQASKGKHDNSKEGACPTDLTKKPPQPMLNAISLEKRINEVISQNQAIVETLDPFWKGRYMRQSSREAEIEGGKSQRGSGRRFSQTASVSDQNQDGKRSYSESSSNHTNSIGNQASNLVQQPQHTTSSAPYVLNDGRASSNVPFSQLHQQVAQPPIPVSFSSSSEARKPHTSPHLSSHPLYSSHPLTHQQVSGNHQPLPPGKPPLQPSHQQPSVASIQLPTSASHQLHPNANHQLPHAVQQPLSAGYPPQQQHLKTPHRIVELEQVQKQPPRPDSNIPLNLSDSSSRKRKSPEALSMGDSVKEVWLNSQKRSGSISQLEDIASRIETSLRSSENPFHPDNPEGSIIKDLLLKTRAGILTTPALMHAAKELQDKEFLNRPEVQAVLDQGQQRQDQGQQRPDQGQQRQDQGQPRPDQGRQQHRQDSIKPKPEASRSETQNIYIDVSKSDDRPAAPEVRQGSSAAPELWQGSSESMDIPMPRSILYRPSSSESLTCNLCQVTNLENIEIHKRHFCKNNQGVSEANTLYRPNSTVSHTKASPTHRRRSDSINAAQPAQKRPRTDSVSASTSQLFFETGKSEGLLQIATVRCSPDHSRSSTTTVSSVSGIPTPNLSGILTGIKPLPLFSLPGVRMDPKHDDKTVPFVLGIPGPYSQPSSRPLTSLTSSISLTSTSSLQYSNSSYLSGVNLSTRITSSPTQSFQTITSPPPSLPSGYIPAGQLGFIKPSDSLPTLLSPIPPRERHLSAPSNRSPKPDPKPTLDIDVKRPQSLPLGGPLSLKKNITLSGASLISPETPRPKKPYVLHYQNGTAYTYLGLKCSTRVFFCSIHKAQPNYVELEKNSTVSMYSNWKVFSKDSHPSGLPPQTGMASYISNPKENYKGMYTVAAPARSQMITSHSSTWRDRRENTEKPEEDSVKSVTAVEGGFKSSDDNYTYIRGRGRGKYICDSCGIRCKKPSMLKKHIRTHTNVRPYTCKYCNFSFKTKGNLTKHMKSKAHSKKCVELGIVPVPTSVEDSQLDDSKSSNENNIAGDSDTDDGEDVDDLEEDEEDEVEEKYDASEGGGGAAAGLGFQGSLGLAPRFPRFSSYPFNSSAGGTPSSIEKDKMSLKMNLHQQDQERVSKITQLASGVGYQPEIKTEPETVYTGNMDTRMTVVPARSSYLHEPGFQLSQYPTQSDPQQPHYPTQPNPQLPGSKMGSDLNSPSSLYTSRPRFIPGEPPGQPSNSLRYPPNLQNPLSDLQYRPSSQIASAGLQYAPSNLQYPSSSLRHPALSLQIPPGILQRPPSSLQTSGPESENSERLQTYLQEYAAFKAKQINTQFQSKIVKEELPESVEGESRADMNNPTPPNQPQPFRPVAADCPDIDVADESQDSEAGTRKEYVHSFGHQTDSIPQNVTMNVKDIPNFLPGHTLPPPPEFNIPTINKAESPLRKPDLKARVSDTGNRPAEMIGRQQDSAGVGGGRSTDSPASTSSTENDEGRATRQIEIFQINEDGKSVCGICSKIFSKSSQLRLHVNIHYFERPFRCDSCAVSFRTKGHLQKHKRSVGHFNKVNINATFGAPSTDNPRPFKCVDCMIAFRIHGHLAKHLRSKLHIMKLECLGKLPIGMYAEMERLGTNLNEIDTTDCENSLESLQQMAVKLYEKDPSKLTSLEDGIPSIGAGSDLSEDEDSNPAPETGLQQTQENLNLNPETVLNPDIKEEPGVEMGQEEVRHDHERLHARQTPESILQPSEQLRSTPEQQLIRRTPEQQLMRRTPEQFTKNPQEAYQKNPQEQFLRRPPSNPPTFLSQASFQPGARMEDGRDFSTRPGRDAIYSPSFVNYESQGSRVLYEERVIMDEGRRRGERMIMDEGRKRDERPIRDEGRRRDEGMIMDEGRRRDEVRMMNDERMREEDMRRDSANIVCHICSLVLPSESSFQQHLATHSKPRPYICQHCDAGFSSVHQLNSHVALHQSYQN